MNKERAIKMKRFKDLTNDEIYHLEEEEIKYWVDLECAFSDKPLPPPPLGEEPEKPEINPDLELYGIGLYAFYYVKNEKEAAIILEAMKAVSLFKVEYKDSVRIARKADDDEYSRAITPVKCTVSRCMMFTKSP